MRGTIERSSSLATLLRGMHPFDLFGRYAELLEHRKPVKHQVERDVLAIAEVEYLNVVQPDGAAGWRDVAHRAVKYAVVSARDGGIDGLGTRLPARA